MASTANFQAAVSSMLSGTLAGVPGGLLQQEDRYRRYRSGLSIGVQEHGSLTYSRRSIFYEVGRRTPRLNDALAFTKNDEEITMVDASVPINPAQAANFEGWARKYSNFSPQWEMMDLAGIVERLAKAVAAQSVYGGVTCANLRAGQPVRVVALGTLDSPQTASVNSVFIPRTVETTTSDGVFAVLSAAANGEGASVTTDVLRLDAGTNQPIVPTVDNAVLATSCVEALRILGANLEESGAGDVFALAVTRGVHSVLSVVGHTDEGGWIRGVFRHCTFRVPYGGINPSLREYPGLPPLASTLTGHISAWCDAIALKSAAAVAHCDPCVTASGGTYPTVFTSNRGLVSPPGTDEADLGDADADAVGRQVGADLGRFSPVYMDALTTIFGLRAVSGVADAVFRTVGRDYLNGAHDRHLRHKTVAPYFWIEPTSLIPAGAFGTVAEQAGFGALTTPGVEREQPAFEKVRELDHGRNANYATIAFKMRSARTSGLICAYAGTPASLTGLRLYQFDEESVVLAGDQGPTGGRVAQKHAAADPISSYLWRRGQSPIPAPAEFVNTQGSYAAKYKIVEWDEDFDATLGDLPEAFELEQYSVRWRVTVPTGLPNGPSNAGDSGAKRARSRAAISLAQATIRNRGLGDANSPVISVSNVPPSWEDEPGRPMAADIGDHRVGVADGQVYASGADRHVRGDDRGAALNPVAHHQPLRGAPYPPRGGGVLPGGGGPALPPQPPAGPPPAAPPSGGDNGSDVSGPANEPDAGNAAPAPPL
ncbi:coat protein [Phomopsis vexans RNA virus]|uniref:Coat protein n=1 Tax=Phomopsis vexans RNA virus TaxID=1580605 RepID=A0A0A7RU00_9VIRU|nr:coat protein [Phomopsis vexans RNA virus]AJA41108.1 coat protein [Phomopsis vexans RNA virus]